MRLATRGALFLAAALAVPAVVAAQTAGAVPLLVEADWLAQHVNDRNVVVIHVGDRGSFERAHLAGASRLAEDDVAKPHDMARGDLMLELPEPAALRQRLEAAGISDDSHVVVYAGLGTPFQSATRIVLTLDAAGLGARTSLLNGGITAWQKSGRPVTSAPAVVTPGRLRPLTLKPVVVDAAFVKGLAGRSGHRLIDARAPAFYRGTEPTFEKRGHIPGAINVPFSDITDASGLVDRARLAKVFADAGVKSGDTIVAYCHIGQQATAVVFAARLLGHDAVLYDGAFQDWATRNRGATEP